MGRKRLLSGEGIENLRRFLTLVAFRTIAVHLDFENSFHLKHLSLICPI